MAVTNTVTGQVTRFYADCIRRDADGNLVKKSDGAGTVMIVNGLYEEAGGVATSYYTFGGQRVAMRVAGAVYWLHGDHLGSASLTTSITGTKVAELRYLPFGKTRWAWGRTVSATTPTDRRYTGQRELPAIGLYDYNARMYWPGAGRFVSADTVAPGPGNPQSLNRYSYVRNSPLMRVDPDGHLDIIALIAGFSDQYTDNMTLGLHSSMNVDVAERMRNTNSTEYTIGRVAADIATLIGGGSEAIGGGSLAAASVAGGVGCMVATVGACVPVGAGVAAGGAVVGGAMVMHGTAVVVSTLSHAGDTAGKLFMQAGIGSNNGITPPTDRGGLRRNMEKAGNVPPNGMRNPQAHHNLPWKFRDWFAGPGRGLNVNDSMFGRWVEGTPPGQHQNWTRLYQDAWEDFIARNPAATRQEVIDYLNQLLSSGQFPAQ